MPEVYWESGLDGGEWFLMPEGRFMILAEWPKFRVYDNAVAVQVFEKLEDAQKSCERCRALRDVNI